MQFHNMQADVTAYKDEEVFTSYKTLISVYRDGVLYVGRCFDCSATTRRQFSRYLYERFGIRYSDIKKDVNEILGTGEIRQCKGIRFCAAEDYMNPVHFAYIRSGKEWY